MGMRPKQEEIRSILDEIQKVIASEPAIALTDGEIAEKINVEKHLQLTANSVWYYRQELGIPSCGNRRKAYKDGEAKT